MAKISAALILASLLVMSAFVSSSASVIGYSDLQRDGIPGIPNDTAANPYRRGCLAAQRCRGGRKLLIDDAVAENLMQAAEKEAENLMQGAEKEAGGLMQGAEKEAEGLKQKIMGFFNSNEEF